MSLSYRSLSGVDFSAYVEDVARLRMAVFREFPYLYEGSYDYEKKYLSFYLKAPDFFAVLAFSGSEIVGASTALPLSSAEPVLQEPFQRRNEKVEDYFYFGESVLLPQYRGQGSGQIFFKAREDAGRSKGFKKLCFCAVERSLTHPQRPSTYQDLFSFWQKNGFQKHPELQAQLSWQEVGEAAESKKPMNFWLKELT